MTRNNEKMLVTTQAYNAEKTIGRTIESVLSQTFTDFIYNITDNGSTDLTQSIIRDYMNLDKRIRLTVLEKNDPLAYREVTSSLLRNFPNLEWGTGVDADDELKADSIGKVYSFALQNNLDLVAFGYELVDGESGSVIKRRELEENLILSGGDFADKFIIYRGFTTFGWGKMTSRAVFLNAMNKHQSSSFYHYFDTVTTLDYFLHSKRVGIFGEALYRAWQYPQSLGRQFHSNRIESDWFAFEANKRYLEHYGKISELNMDFLYAIQLSILQETLERICDADMPLAVKIKQLIRMFEHQTAQDTLTRKADPQFRNLSQRQLVVQNLKKWIYRQNGWDLNRDEVARLMCLLEVANENSKGSQQ